MGGVLLNFLVRCWGGEGGGSLNELRPPICNPLCGDVSQGVSKATQRWALEQPGGQCASQDATSG